MGIRAKERKSMKISECYPYHCNDGTWCLVLVVDGHRDIAKGVWQTEQDAIEYGRKRGWIYP